jgi:AcrR family transcriptional regulator
VTRQRLKKRVRNPVQTRAKLLQATSDLIAQKGVEALSMKEAARRANVSRAMAYQHFEDRDHLVREAKSWLSGRLMQFISDVSDASVEDSVGEVARLVLNNVEASKLFMADAFAGKNLDARHPLYKRVLQILEEFKASDKARADIDVEMMSFILLGSIATLIMLTRLREQHNSEALAQRFTTEWSRVLRHGIFRPEPRSRGRKQRSST